MNLIHKNTIIQKHKRNARKLICVVLLFFIFPGFLFTLQAEKRERQINNVSGISSAWKDNAVITTHSLAKSPSVQKRDYEPIPVLICSDFSKFKASECSDYQKLRANNYVPTCLSNGVLSISPGPNPLIATMNNLNKASTVVCGFVHKNPAMKEEELSPAPYPLGIDLKVGESSFRQHLDKVKITGQSLDMSSGELTTSLWFEPGNDFKLKIQTLQFASRSVPSVVCEQITLISSKDTVIELSTLIDMEGTDCKEYAVRTRNLTEVTPEGTPNIVDRVKGYESDLGSRLGIALLLPHKTGLSFKQEGKYSITLRSNVPFEFEIIASMVSDLYHPDPFLEAIRCVRWAEMVSFENLQQKNRDIWKELWKSRIKITGGRPGDQLALDVAFYYLQSNIHSSSRMGYPPFGLTQNWAYSGHNFWDMDLWTFLPTLLCQPAAAKSMIEYRFKGLEGAKSKAALFGYRGALYPWEASRDGWEVTPSNAATGWAEQHTIGPALSAWQYYLVNPDDKEFLVEKIWPILREVATWLESRGEFTQRGFEFRNLMGPDEWVTNINNPSYFNLLAKKVLQNAIQCAKEVGKTVPMAWEKMADQIFLPSNPGGTIIYPYDNTTKAKVFNQAEDKYEEAEPKLEGKNYSLGNLHFLFVHGLPLSESLFRNTYFAEEKIRLSAEAYPGVPGSARAPGFTSPSYMAAAAFCGERTKSADLFVNSWKPYWHSPYGMTSEYQSQYYGSYITTFGSLLENTMLGLTGLRIQNGDWHIGKATLPAGWEKIEIDRIWINGKPVKLEAENDKMTILTTE
jgi:protein-glucosylgalactosylhydroxylysine glucosidase